MRKAIAIVIQIIILTAAVFAITNTIEDNTYFGLIYGDIVENIRWVLAGAAGLSVLNILIWWPKSPAQQTVEKPAEGIKSTEAEAKAIDEDPKTPTLN